MEPLTLQDIETLKAQVAEFKEFVCIEPKPSMSKCKSQFSEILKKSKTLFDMIYNKYPENTIEIGQRIELFIKLLEDISKGCITQHDASVKVGQHLADKYIFCYQKFKKH